MGWEAHQIQIQVRCAQIMEGGLQCWAHIFSCMVSIPAHWNADKNQQLLLRKKQFLPRRNDANRTEKILEQYQDINCNRHFNSPELGRDEQVLTLGVACLQGCMEAVADGWFVEVVAGTVDVPAAVRRTRWSDSYSAQRCCRP